MKTISDATGIAGKRGVRIPTPRQPEAPESDSQRCLGSHPRAHQNYTHPEGATILCGTQKNVFGASFERRCVFFFGLFGSNENILLNGQEFVSYLIEAQKANLPIKHHPRKMTVLSWVQKSSSGSRTTKRFYHRGGGCCCRCRGLGGVLG